MSEMGIVRFGRFEADLRSGELKKDNQKVKLEGQPLQVLAVLLTRPGELVTRDELRKKLWPDQTYVDFEQGINASVKRLRAALEDSAEAPHFIETLPRRGYRFIGQIRNGAATAVAPLIYPKPVVIAPVRSADENPPPSPPAPLQTASVWRRTLLGVAIVALLAVVALALNAGGWRDRLWGRPLSGEIRAVAVLPFQNLTGDPQQEYFVDGMTDELITELGKISALRVISRTSAMSFKGSKEPVPEIARRLSVDAVLEGAVTRNGDRVRISARLIQTSRERVLWSETYERELRDISKLHSDIVFILADRARVKLLDEEQAQLSRVRPTNPQAYEAYLHGRYLQARRTPQDMHSALEYFQHALEIDSEYAPAYVGIIDCYSIGGGRQMGVSIREADARMKEAAQKVLELDRGSSTAHYALAMVKWHEWDFPGAEKEFRQALALNPGDIQGRQHYAHYLIGMRRPEDARREIQHALALDPLSAMLTVDVGHTYLYAGQYVDAIAQGRKALAMQNDFLYARMLLCWSYWHNGEVEQALEVGWPIPFQPEKSKRAKAIYERDGSAAMLRWLARDAEQHNTAPDFYSRSAVVALWYVLLGDKEKTLLWLEKAYQEHDPWLPMDLASRAFDPLRSDPRFQDLLRRIGLPV